jgi:hypothetical protein
MSGIISCCGSVKVGCPLYPDSCRGCQWSARPLRADLLQKTKSGHFTVSPNHYVGDQQKVAGCCI